jgi:hypothetical protein
VGAPALLYLPGTQRFRIVLRVLVFGLSLLGLALCMARARRSRNHPAWPLLAAGAVYMLVMVLHPTTNTVLAGLAQTALYLAVAAPLYWAPSYFVGNYRRLARVLTILWVLNAASAVVGILQVRDPARWLPAEFSQVVTSSRFSVNLYAYQGADGRIIMRPPGLGDAPGAACGAGMFVAAMGLAYLGLPVSSSRRALGLALGSAGVAVIFLTHVRSGLVVLVGSAVVYAVTLFLQKRVWTGLILSAAILACGPGALWYATALGGRSTVDRFATLLTHDPLAVYRSSARMSMVKQTFDSLIVEYPLGAGLGRWGMMRKYLGDERNLDSPLIWAEVQFAAWVLDGGVVLLSLSVIALVVAVRRLLQCGFRGGLRLQRQWAAVMILLAAGPIALMFSFTPFYAQLGTQFWFLIGAFEGVVQGEEARARAQAKLRAAPARGAAVGRPKPPFPGSTDHEGRDP